ncbi:MAG TPA: adenosine kinase, partial [Alphaproteobacteria bacterium]|nr:adenosine kinase [Alphaproteobacteria bacterium]
MAHSRFDVLTIGNAIVDVIAPIEPGFLEREGMSEGIMHLIDEARSIELYEKMPADKRQISGGSAANTAAGVASLGGRAAFVGKVADDPLGDIFAADLAHIGVYYGVSRLQGGPSTARSMILISPDGERTMNTYLGACHQLTEADIKEDEIGAATVTYMEGFLWDPLEAKKAFVRAANYAHRHERAACFTLSDPFCVDRYRDEFLDLIRSKTMDYVFANINEIKALYRTEDFGAAVQQIARDAELAAITMGAAGAMVVANGEIVTVPAFRVDPVVDATGAGDLFAAGFLLAVARGQELEMALRAGCLAASEVISHIGAR